MAATDEARAPYVVAAVNLAHQWSGEPSELDGLTLRICYRLRSDGAVTRQLVELQDQAGAPIPARRAPVPLDWTEQQEHGGRLGTGKPVVLDCDPAEPAEPVLLTWLERVGLTDGES
jgi:hypothetical protein